MANRLKAPCACSSSSRPRKRGVFSRSGATYSSVMAPVCSRNSTVLRFLPVQRGIEEGRLHPGLVQRADLVVHQRDQRRDHDGHAVAGLLARDRRDLVAQAFAAARGHEHQRIAAARDVADDVGLRPAKRFVAENLAQDG